jgi:hypothetical protein
MKVKFPLPRGFFGDFQFTAEQKEYYHAFCENQVQRGLLDERLHDRNRRTVNPRKWRPVKSLTRTFQLYRRRDGRLHENDGKPSMLGVGRVEGSIEDALYGAYDQSDDELRLTAALVEVDFGDGAVLQNMEQGSPVDPYRYLGIKWVLSPLPPIMHDRDWIVLESSGIATDESGRRYGYHTLFSVELPFVPFFENVVRGKMWYTFIYRDAGRGMIDVHCQGYFDCNEFTDLITVAASSLMLNGPLRYMKAAEAKKLTILALETLEQRLANGGTEKDAERSVPAGAACSMCSKGKSSIALFPSQRLRICRVCDEIVCGSCRVKKNLLVGARREMKKVSVCHRCIAHAKTLIVEPTKEKFIVSRELNPGSSSQGDARPSVAESCDSSLWGTVCSNHHFFGTLKPRADFPSEEEIGPYSSYGGHWDDDIDKVSLPSTRSGTSESLSSDAKGSDPQEKSRTESDHSAIQRELYAKMLELEASAKQACYLTRASGLAMQENATRPS